MSNNPEAIESQDSNIQKRQDGANKLAIASLVLGVLAILSSFTGIGAIIGLIIGIVGWVMGSKARKILPEDQRAFATSGWICSIIAVILTAIGVIITLVFSGGLLMLFSR